MTNAIEEAIEALKPFADVAGRRDLADEDDYEVQTWMNASDFRRASRALAALSAPAVSGLTEEERAKGQKLLADWKALTQRWSDAEDARSPDAEVTILSRRMETAKDILKAFLLFHAEALLSPAPSIDWKRVAEVRERVSAYPTDATIWDDPIHAREQAHADRAFLLSLLPKEEANDGQ